MRSIASVTASLAAGLFAAALAAQQPKAEAKDLGALRKTADAAVQQQDWATAVASFRKLTEAAPDDGRGWHMLGYCLHAQGKLDEALPVHLKAAEFPGVAPIATYNAACVYALKGDKEKALQWLEKAAQAGFGNVDHIDGDTDMDTLRADPRFTKIRKAMADNAANAPAQVMAYAVETPRKQSRIALFSRGGSPGQLVVDYAPIPWKDDYAAQVESQKIEARKWRFGGDFWTSLDTSIDVAIGGVRVPAGYYYLTLERRDGKFVLALHDADAVKAKKLDAYMAHVLEGGIEVPMAHQAADETCKELAIVLKMDEGSQHDGALAVAFGPHRLHADLVLHHGKKQ